MIDEVYCVAISPNDELIVSGGGDDRAFLWRAADGVVLHTLDGSLRVMMIIADYSLIASLSHAVA